MGRIVSSLGFPLSDGSSTCDTCQAFVNWDWEQHQGIKFLVILILEFPMPILKKFENQ